MNTALNSHDSAFCKRSCFLFSLTLTLQRIFYEWERETLSE